MIVVPTCNMLRAAGYARLGGQQHCHQAISNEHLGVHFDNSRFAITDQAASNGYKCLAQLTVLRHKHRGLLTYTALHLIGIALVLKMLWASPVWWAGSQHILNRLEPRHHRALQWATGLPSFVSNRKPILVSRSSPLQCILDYLSTRYAIRLLFIPPPILYPSDHKIYTAILAQRRFWAYACPHSRGSFRLDKSWQELAVAKTVRMQQIVTYSEELVLTTHRMRTDKVRWGYRMGRVKWKTGHLANSKPVRMQSVPTCFEMVDARIPTTPPIWVHTNSVGMRMLTCARLLLLCRAALVQMLNSHRPAILCA